MSGRRAKRMRKVIREDLAKAGLDEEGLAERMNDKLNRDFAEAVERRVAELRASIVRTEAASKVAAVNDARRATVLLARRWLSSRRPWYVPRWWWRRRVVGLLEMRLAEEPLPPW